MSTKNFDLSLYLVTDSTMVPEGRSFLQQVRESVENGASCVQLREKDILTIDFITRAEEVHSITKEQGIPLIINDRVDVALAVDAEGVHVGQDDMPASIVRQLVGEGKIVGVSCSNPEEVEIVCKEGYADYVGLGTVFKTQTKKDVKIPEGVGPIGVRKMLQALNTYNGKGSRYVRSVAIGGINHSNVSRLLFQSCLKERKLDGVAVVSCIMASTDSAEATSDLSGSINSEPCWLRDIYTQFRGTETHSLELKLASVVSRRPLVHHITNNVVKNFSANVALAIGASPIMSEFPEEFDEFASAIPHLSLLINLGTPSEQMLKVFEKGLQSYNDHGKHVIFDPVAAGASSARLGSCLKLLNTGYASVIKGNVGEIAAIWKLTSVHNQQDNHGRLLMRGVDSTASLDENFVIKIGKEVALDFKCIVVITGSTNYVIDGIQSHFTLDLDTRIAKIRGGHELMGRITGSGCSLGTTIAAFVAAKADGNENEYFDIFASVQGAVEFYNRCGRLAGTTCSSPGTFLNYFLDLLYKETCKVSTNSDTSN